ncbi:MAG: enoyl-CoA hydratase/isomerase family protein [Pyrinomonadaceae bacterium]|nr:enoyl-CoA hydratase/isomerase family protein [Pyrinomonadaceae bacterium]
MSLVLLERRDAIANIRLNRPEKLNALSQTMLEDLSDAFKHLKKQPDLRAVILTGSGEAFCAGTDIKELAGLDQNGARAASERGQAVCNQIANCPVPVIAAINGIAAGGGCELALACHLRVASTNAQFTLPEIKLGVIPGYGGTQRLPFEMGYGRALEVMLTGKTLSAEQGYQFGLVNQVTDPANVFTAAESLAKDIAKLAPLAVRACLRAVTRGLELSLQEGLTLEAELFASLFGTDDMREGTSAFLEKRTPVFKGTRSKRTSP